MQGKEAYFIGGRKLAKASLTTAGATGPPCELAHVGFAFDALDEVLVRATEYTAVTHNHIEGIKGAQSTSSHVRFSNAGGSTLCELRCFTRESEHQQERGPNDSLFQHSEFSSCRRNTCVL